MAAPSLFSMTPCVKSLLWSHPHCAVGAEETVSADSFAPGTRLGVKLPLSAPQYWVSTSPYEVPAGFVLCRSPSGEGTGFSCCRLHPDLPLNPGGSPLPQVCERGSGPQSKDGTCS